MKNEKNNFGFIAASSICIFLLLIMIVGNFGGKGTRAAEGSIPFGDYMCVDDSGSEPMDGRGDKCGICEGSFCYKCSCSENADMTEAGCTPDLINVLGGCEKVESGSDESDDTTKTEIKVPTCSDSEYTGYVINLSDNFSSTENISYKLVHIAKTEVGSYDIPITVSDTSKYVFENGSTTATVTCKIVKHSAAGNKTEIDVPTCGDSEYTGELIDLTDKFSNKTNISVLPALRKEVGSYNISITVSDTSKYVFKSGSTSASVTCKIVKNSDVGDRTVISKPTCSSALYTGNKIDLANNVSNSNGYFEVTSNEQTNEGSYNVSYKIKDSTKYSFSDGSTTGTVSCAITKENCSISFTNGKSEIEAGKSFTVTANVTPVSGAKVSSYSWSVSNSNVSITSGASSQLATFKAGSSVGNATIILTVKLDNDKTCSKSFDATVVASTGGSSSSSSVGSKLTVSFKNGDDTVETKTCTVTSNTLGCVGVVTPAAPQAKDGYRFNGWGTSKGCTSGVFAANYAISSITKNKTYYACFVEDNDEVDDSYTVDKCSFSGPYTVSSLVPDYEGCKHYGVYYDGKQEFAYVKHCCIDKGYVWVGENFSTAKSAYCITCSSDNGGNNGGDDTGSDNGGIGGGDDTGNNNTTSNPQTGSALIFVVWSIGIAMVVYAFWYFKTSKEY